MLFSIDFVNSYPIMVVMGDLPGRRSRLFTKDIPMAENESLDLDDPYGRRWGVLVRSIRKHETFNTVIGRVRKALYGGPRNALKQMEKYGVTLQMLLDNRNSPHLLAPIGATLIGEESHASA